MKLKEGFITHETNGKQILVSAGKVRFSGLVRSNKTAAFIVDCLKYETSADEIVEKMLRKYDAPQEIIAKDVNMVIENLRSIGALDE